MYNHIVKIANLTFILFTDTSSSDDESHNARSSATLYRNKRPLSYGAGDHDEASNPKRQSVIVRQGSNSLSSANNSTSNAADDQAGNVLPVHKTFFKSKLAPEPLIDQKAKAMYVIAKYHQSLPNFF